MAKTILIVEDDETNAAVVHDYLAAHGYDTVVARDGIEGVRKFEELRPDLLILDLLLPRKNGFEVCTDVRSSAAGRDTPILLMSAVGREVYEEAYAAIHHYAQGYLRKPFSMATLAQYVSDLVGTAEH